MPKARHKWPRRKDVPRYYRERRTGDYLVAYPDMVNPGGSITTRAAAIAGHVGSVCTCSASPSFLRNQCVRVDRSEVPPRWLAAFGDDEESPCPAD